MQPSKESLTQPMSVEEKRRLLKELLAAGGRRTEPVAIIGMSGRYPMAPNLAAFWDNLRSGRHCISEFRPERWDGASISIPIPTRRRARLTAAGAASSAASIASIRCSSASHRLTPRKWIRRSGCSSKLHGPR